MAFCLMIMSIHNSHAQILEKLEKKVEQKVKQRADQKVDKAIRIEINFCSFCKLA